MGRIVWFGAPLIGGFGLPAVAVVGTVAVVGGAIALIGGIWLGRRSAKTHVS
jgi:hypothetical protein